MPETDLTDRVSEQLAPIIAKVHRRAESDLTERDKAAIGHGLVEAAVMGARVAWTAVLSNAAEAGVDISSIDISGVEHEDHWPYPE